MNKKTIKTLIFVVLASSLITLTYAENTNSNNKNLRGTGNPTTGVMNNLEKKQENFEQLKEKVMEQRQNRIENRCEILTGNIDKRIEQYETNKGDHAKRFEKLQTLVSNLITKLETKGYDVTKLKTDLNTLNSKVTQYKSDFAAFIDALKSTKDYACGESEGSFLDAIQAAKTKLEAVRTDVEAIRDYYKNTIKPDIKAVRAQKVEAAETTEE